MYLESALVIIGLLLISSIWIIIAGPTAWQRLQGTALFSSKITLLIVLISLLSDQSYILDMALVHAMLGFISLVLIARYVSRRRQI